MHKNISLPVWFEILRRISCQGCHIFTHVDALAHASKLGIKKNRLNSILSDLCKKNLIERIKKGVFAFTLESGMSSSPHEFEVAQSICPMSAVSHWTAMHYHHITQQTPRVIFSVTTKRISVPRNFKECYKFQQVVEKRFFGIEKVWVCNARVNITDLEKTLLDGLSFPGLCGGIEEVYNAFSFAKDRLNLTKIISYALQSDVVITKRLGWMLSQMGYAQKRLIRLKKRALKGFGKLDPLRSNDGIYDHEWQLQLNA